MAIHPTQSYVMYSSDNSSIRLLDWDQDWRVIQTFHGHLNAVNHITFDPNDSDTFASASADCTSKVWTLKSCHPLLTLEGHKAAVNGVDFHNGRKDPCLIPCSNDSTIKVWNLKSGTCIETIICQQNVSSVCVCLDLPVIVGGSNSGAITLYDAHTFRPQKTRNYGFQGIHKMAYVQGSRRFVIGYEGGIIMIEIGREFPLHDMHSVRNIVWQKDYTIESVNVKTTTQVVDGKALDISLNMSGRSNVFPEMLRYNHDGRRLVVAGEGKYIIYALPGFTHKFSGSASNFAWSPAGDFAIKEDSSRLSIFKKSCSLSKTMSLAFEVDCIFGGVFLSTASAHFICFYDWSDGGLIYQFNAKAIDVFWGSDLLCVASDANFYILKFNRELVEKYIKSGKPGKDGCGDAFIFLHKVNERIRTAIWAGDKFIYINSAWRLSCCLRGEVNMIYHMNRPSPYLDFPMRLLGYNGNHLYLINSNLNIVRYALASHLIEYMDFVIQGKMEQANSILRSIPIGQYDCVAHFLESRGKLKDDKLDLDRLFETLKAQQKVSSIWNKVGLNDVLQRTRGDSEYLMMFHCLPVIWVEFIFDSRVYSI